MWVGIIRVDLNFNKLNGGGSMRTTMINLYMSSSVDEFLRRLEEKEDLINQLSKEKGTSI